MLTLIPPPSQDPSLNIGAVSTLMYDWMHMWLCDGILDNELGLAMKRFERTGVTSYAELDMYFGQWTLPKALPKVGHLLKPECAKKFLASQHFSCNASDLLTLYPILQVFLTTVARARSPADMCVEALVAAFVCVDLLQNIKRGLVTKEQLNDAIVRHHELFKRCYDDDAIKPKFHYALHHAAHLDHFGLILSTFTHERKHKILRRAVQNRRNTTSYELSALEEITLGQLDALSQPFLKHGLIDERAPCSVNKRILREMYPATDISVACKVSFGAGVLTVGDAVLARVDGALTVNMLVIAFAVDGNLLALVENWPSLDRTQTGHRHVVGKERLVIPMESLQCSLIYRLNDGMNIATVLMPSWC